MNRAVIADPDTVAQLRRDAETCRKAALVHLEMARACRDAGRLEDAERHGARAVNDSRDANTFTIQADWRESHAV